MFKFYRTKVKELIDAAYRQYTQSLECNIRLSPASFWRHVKSKRNQVKQLSEYTYKGKTVIGQEAVNSFADYFSSVFLTAIPQLNAEAAEAASHDSPNIPSVAMNSVSSSDLRVAVKKLKACSAVGPDGVPGFLVKDCLSALESPLLHIYNLSLQEGIYPNPWKVSRVTPVPKSGSSIEVEAQRPIAILSIFGKIFESIVNRCITAQISHRFHDSQHGFRRGRSTTTNHIMFVDYVVAQMDAGRYVDCAYFDLAKAFDVVDNDLLLIKLSRFGFTPHLLTFFASYLKDRRQYVQMGRYLSEDYYTRSGVSQGSTLGPTLFLVMVDDLPRVLKSTKCLMFADDMKVYSGLSGSPDIINFQCDIDAVANWARDNNLKFNAAKCKVITYTRSRIPVTHMYSLGGVSLERVVKIRDLGVVMDSALRFDEHIMTICKKANKTLGFISRTSAQFKDINIPILLYNAYVRSVLEFGSVVWDPKEKKYTLLLERVQRKFARYLYKRKYGYYPFLFPSLFVSGMVGLLTLELRRKLLLIIHYCMLLRNQVNNPTVLARLNYYVPNSYTRTGERRHRLLARADKIRTQHAHNAPTARAVDYINNFLDKVQDVDIHVDPIGHIYKCIALHLSVTL